MAFFVDALPILAQSAIVSSLACYGFNRFNPSPHPTFMLMIGVTHTCAGIIITQLQSSAINFLTERYDKKDRKQTEYKFSHLSNALVLTMMNLLPIFYRVLGQALGYQVPGHLYTCGYVILASNANWLFTSLYEGILGSTIQPVDIPQES